jgi:poly-gamma-glutamate synthesis protein (capsule biosynthesis protein)
VRSGGRAVIVSCGTASAGIPPGWAAAPARPGVNRLADLSPATADDLISQAQAARRPGDITIISIHWGPNWGYDLDADQVRFARRLIDGGVDLVHGHSCHHPRPVEVYRGKLILYGCGDCIDDYEGITSHRAYRPDLRLLYFASLDPGTGQLAALRMAPMQARRMRLQHAPAEDRQWLTAVLDRISHGLGSRIELRPDGMLALRPHP